MAPFHFTVALSVTMGSPTAASIWTLSKVMSLASWTKKPRLDWILTLVKVMLFRQLLGEAEDAAREGRARDREVGDVDVVKIGDGRGLAVWLRGGRRRWAAGVAVVEHVDVEGAAHVFHRDVGVLDVVDFAAVAAVGLDCAGRCPCRQRCSGGR